MYNQSWLSLKYGFRSAEPLKCGTTESAPNIRKKAAE